MPYILTRQAEEDLIQIYLYGLKVFGSMQADEYPNSLEKPLSESPKTQICFPLLPISEKDIGFVFMLHLLFFHDRRSHEDN
ncbi:type II toxin-antitoxin system RelE/ParE family toxin [Negadavirga shengliensis]|uniref:Type II toxin-antitoxin system RelE/ParE family toxin n=1 Tax=Negadavirga shengliensis TaxID=1389218 RepID=A0ABV9T0Z6_9BACT